MENFRLRTLEKECADLIESSGAHLMTENTGVHYLLSSGMHTDEFYQLARVFECGPIRERLADLMLPK